MDDTTTAFIEDNIERLKKNKTNGLVNGDNGNISESSKEENIKYFGGLLEFRTKLVWPNIFGLLVLHCITVYALWIVFSNFLTWKYFATFFYNVGIGILGGMGVSYGAHRLYTHKAYKAKAPLRIFYLILFTLSGENSLYEWSRDHRQHHKFSDTDADPHNANRGFFFAHMGWLVMRKHPKVLQKGKTIDMSDLEMDPHVRFQKRYFVPLFFILNFLTALVPIYLFGCTGWESFWTTIARVVILWNVTWCINSVAHFYGTKPYDKNIFARNNGKLASISLGEGWHNFHHTFPWDYRLDEIGRTRPDSSNFIDFCARRGWAYDLKMANEETVMKIISRTGDGSFKISRSNLRDNPLQRVKPPVKRVGES